MNMCDKETVEVGQMSETVWRNLVVIIPEAANYLANTEIDRISLVLIIESVLNGWREKLDSPACSRLSTQMSTDAAEAIDNARMLLSERRYNELDDELYYIEWRMMRW